MTEYGLIALLVLGGLTVALANLGSVISNQFLSILGPSSNQSSTANASGMPTGTIASGGVTTLSASAGGGQVKITLASGAQLQLSNYPLVMSTAVNTTGANGTTDMLADTIQSVAAQLLASGDVTQTQANALTALANQAHYIASIEKALEDAAAKAPSSAAFMNTPIEFNGKTYTPTELRQLIGYGNGSGDPNSVADPMTYTSAYPESAAFQALYQQAVQSGALNDPVALQTVQALSDQVAYLSDLTTITTNNITLNYITPAEMAQSMASEATHTDAKGICVTGSGTDTGVQCSG